MKTSQMGLWEASIPNCPFLKYIDNFDKMCSSNYFSKGYDTLSCTDPRLSDMLANINNIDFSDISFTEVPRFSLPEYIPGIRHGSEYMIKGVDIPYLAITLGEIINIRKKSIYKNLKQRFGVSNNTKLILLSYGKDRLIEAIWPDRKRIFEEISRLDIYMATAINYSIWFNQPHAERLINLKRSLITFSEMKQVGINVIPHIYWYNMKDLDRWIEWINDNPHLGTIAVNLQTQRQDFLWDPTLEQLKYLICNISNNIHVVITGPTVLKRITDLKKIVPSLTITNSLVSNAAACRQIIKVNDGKIKKEFNFSITPKEAFQVNLQRFRSIMRKSYKNN